MDAVNRKYGWTEKGIVGFIFSPIGLIFLIIGLALVQTPAVDDDERLAFLICFVGLGAAFLLAGVVLLLLDLRRRRRQRAAYEGGHCVMAKIAGARENLRVNMMGRHPVMVECHYTDPDTGVVHVYFSRYLYTDVADLLLSDEVPVYLDHGDPGTGFVDIDAVLPTIAVHR